MNHRLKEIQDEKKRVFELLEKTDKNDTAAKNDLMNRVIALMNEENKALRDLGIDDKTIRSR